MEIGFDIIEQLKKWNQEPSNQCKDTDNRFVLALLFVLVEREDIVSDHISSGIVAFITGGYISYIVLSSV